MVQVLTTVTVRRFNVAMLINDTFDLSDGLTLARDANKHSGLKAKAQTNLGLELQGQGPHQGLKHVQGKGKDQGTQRSRPRPGKKSRVLLLRTNEDQGPESRTASKR